MLSFHTVKLIYLQKKTQKLPNVNHEIQAQGEQEIQLQEVQTPIKENIFDKSSIPEPILLEEKNRTRTKNDSEITYPLSKNIFQPSNDEQQHIKLEQDEESKQEPSVLKYFPENGRAGANEQSNREPESAQTISEDTDVFLATDKNSAQETKSGPESTGWNVEEFKTLPTISTRSTTEQALPTFQKHSPNHTTSSQENAFANMVFGKSAKRENAIDIESSNYKLENKGTNLVTTESLHPVFLNNEVVQDLDNTKIKKEPHNDEISQLERNGKCRVTATCEKPFSEKVMQRAKENLHAPAYDQSATTENIAFSKMDSKSLFPKQNEQEINALQGKRYIDVLDLGQTLSNEENKTEVDFHLENKTDAFPVNAKLEQTLNDKENKTEMDLQLKKNDTNAIPVKDQPFTIVSIKKRICNIPDNPSINETEFRNLRNFWDKGTKIDVGDDAQSVLANTPDGKRRMITKMPTSTEPEMLLEAKHLVTKKPVLIQRVQTPSNSHTPDELSENESKKAQLYSGPSVQERMQQIRQQRETQTEKKKLNTKYFPKVLPTEPEEIIKFKKATNESNENKLQSSDFQNHSSEVELSDHEPVDRRIVNSQEDINLRNSASRPSTSDKIGNNDVENIPEKRFHSRIPSVLKPAGISYQDKISSVGQSSSREVSNNEENLTLFAGHSLVVKENDILQKKLSKYEPLDNAIQRSLKSDDLGFEEEENLSPVKTDKLSKYDEDLGVALDKDRRGFDLEDEFKSDLNLPPGITKKSNFKEIYASPIKKSGERFKSDIPYNPYQDVSPKNVLSNYSGGNDHLRAESQRRSLSEEEEMSASALKRNSRLNETYKSLQDINATSSMSDTLDSANKEMILSADNVYTIPISPENTSLQSKRMKRLSKSVPAFPENDDADSMSESSFQMDRRGTIASSLTNISSSSGMASRSSISGSTMSIYSGDFGNIDVRGKMQFSLDYVDKLKEFHIFVVRCSDLAAAEKKNRSDPYVKSYLLPDKIKMGKRKTSVKKKSLNPVYNEILRYKIEKATLLAQTLNLSVWHNDTFGRNSFLGEVEIELKNWDWSNKKMDWFNLKPRTLRVNRLEDKGSLKVAIRYIPQGHGGKKTGEVHIWVKEASNLPQIRPNRLDSFVKCFILPDTSRKSRQSTRVVKKNRNPVFNHTMVYDGFRPEDLKDACVELSVWDRDKLRHHFLGGLRIGLGTGKSYGLAVDWMDSTEEEVSVWDKMITHPTVWIENVLPLRMLMLSKMSAN
ncbi:synaptotagmin-like protein 2 isoform X2 [Scyliorhinus canicula]|uniref:synaptotagmin-like protein 2 isoform X2 n=1 Tax=Scyliorhinus canicula TaxID=7830 RepID=UPI0018F5C749|nr:synaptotagmin-like protein 2 isoform X2 [Scyliorhinus canicula]